jgi:hypothetical protein
MIIFGNGAVGKMTVGQELTKITEFSLFHNHMSIEPILEVFGYFHKNAIFRIRDVVFEEFAKTEKYGLIFTYMWAFEEEAEWKYIEHVCDIFRAENPDLDVYYVELVAPQEIRLERNVSENRLANKPSKREIEVSNLRLKMDDAMTRIESYDGEFDKFENYIKIDNTNIPAAVAAKMIKECFGL